MSEVTAAATRFSHGEIDRTTFVRTVTDLPKVAQNAIPRTPVNDAYVLNKGPVYDLREALRLRLIDGETYDLALKAMAEAGHAA